MGVFLCVFLNPTTIFFQYWLLDYNENSEQCYFYIRSKKKECVCVCVCVCVHAHVQYDVDIL